LLQLFFLSLLLLPLSPGLPIKNVGTASHVTGLVIFAAVEDLLAGFTASPSLKTFNHTTTSLGVLDGQCQDSMIIMIIVVVDIFQRSRHVRVVLLNNMLLYAVWQLDMFATTVMLDCFFYCFASTVLQLFFFIIMEEMGVAATDCR